MGGLTIVLGPVRVILDSGAEMLFADFPWHDAILVSVVINRDDPGNSDRVELVVRTVRGSIYDVVFSECYSLELTMNFGIYGDDTIRFGREASDTSELESVLRKWDSVGVRLEGLKEFELTTNSTGSCLKVHAQACGFFVR